MTNLDMLEKYESLEISEIANIEGGGGVIAALTLWGVAVATGTALGNAFSGSKCKC